MATASLDAFRQAILSGSGLNVPGAGGSPNMGGAGTANADTAIQHLQGLARSSFQVPAATGAATGAAGEATNEDETAKAAAKLKLSDVQDQLSTLNQTKSDMADPTKYYRVQNKSGGWNFYAPDGTKIDAQAYATVKGQHVTDAVKGSQNTRDQEFLQDYKDVSDLGQIMQSGDKTALDKLYKSDPTLKDRIGHMTYAQIVQQFRSSYPNYFAGQTDDVGNASYNNTSPNPKSPSFLDRIKGLFN